MCKCLSLYAEKRLHDAVHLYTQLSAKPCETVFQMRAACCTTLNDE